MHLLHSLQKQQQMQMWLWKGGATRKFVQPPVCCSALKNSLQEMLLLHKNTWMQEIYIHAEIFSFGWCRLKME